MATIKAWISAFRLRTLPLAVAGIILGSFLSKSANQFNWPITIWGVITAILLQILSNLANDYGDFTKGTDNENRVGPTRALQSGAITQSQMKLALIICSSLTFLSGIWLLNLSFGPEKLWYAVGFLILGVLAIWAAIKYTVGESAYGYHGLGDLFVFIFFGWVSVVGMYFLNVQSIDLAVFLPASCLGLLSAGVLNLNNTRDIVNDEISNKITLAVRLGFSNAKKYQFILFLATLLCAISYNFMQPGSLWQHIYLLAFLPLGKVVMQTIKESEPKRLDPLLKIQALSTLLFAILFGLGQVI